MALKELWVHLESYLLLGSSRDGKIALEIRQQPPSVQTIDSIVAMVYVFEALMPVLKHLTSARGVARALATAGMSNHSGLCLWNS